MIRETVKARKISKEVRKFLVSVGVNFRNYTFKTEIIDQPFLSRVSLKLYIAEEYLGAYFDITFDGYDASILEYIPKEIVFNRNKNRRISSKYNGVEEVANDIYMKWVKNASQLHSVIVGELKVF